MNLKIFAALAAAMTCAPSFSAETVAYTYDALGRLVKSEHAGTTNNGLNEQVSYDAAGNRTNITVVGPQSVIVVPMGNLTLITIAGGL